MKILCKNTSFCWQSFRELSREDIVVSHLIGEKVKPTNDSAVCIHLLHCNYLSSFDNFSNLAHENKKLLLEIKESLPVMR